MKYRFITLDVFTEERFGGNPLAVVLGADGLSGAAMQRIAGEFNLSETTFVLKPSQPDLTVDVRIFTPANEMPFAGHPSVGTAVALALEEAGEGDIDREIVLGLKAGRTPVRVTRAGGKAPFGHFIAPVVPEAPRDGPSDEVVAAAISLDAGDIGFDGHRPRFIKAGNDWLFAPVASLDAVARSAVDASAWAGARDGNPIIGIYVYARGGEGAAFHARMFAPDAGVPEDPATGSAAVTLPGQILASEGTADGSHDWLIEQGFEMGRPSRIHLSADVRDGAVSEVRLGGHAVPVSSGEIEV